MATEIAANPIETVVVDDKTEGTEEKGGVGEETDPATHTDSGHESSASVCTPELPSTPVEEQKEEKFAEKQSFIVSSADSRFFRVRVLVPGGESIDVQINESDIVQELYHMLLERDSTCHRTCFKLYYDGTALDHFTEIRNVPGIKDNAIMRVIEEPYNLREARVHVRHLREIIRSVDISDAVNGVEFASLSCLSTITQSTSDDSGRKSKGSSAIELLRTESDCLPPEWLLPNSIDVPFKPLIPIAEHSNSCLQPTQLLALKQISFSAFNPPPGPRKMKGDILYLVVDTVEDRRFHITCCTRGFYVNSSIGEKFKPDRSSTYGGRVFHSLFDLLSDDQLRADEQIQPHRLGLEDHMPGQIRDWNEELQTTHDMPQSNFAEKLCRDRARFKVHADFLSACIRGATAVIDGSVHTINPMDEPRMHMFIWNNIFFSLGFDVKDHYKELGGDAAAHASYAADLAAVQAYAQIDDPKLHTSGMAIVDFKGFRVMAQSIIPGILEREQQDSIVYGSYDSGKTVTSIEIYEELLKNSAKILKIEPHLVWNGKEGDESKVVKLFSSYESKGIVGNDRRHYLMDLLRTFPPDVNFLESAEPTEFCKAQGFPRKFKHKLVYLRQELVDAFTDFKNEQAKEERDINERQKKVEKEDAPTDIAQEAEEETTDEPDVRLNPDAWSTAVRHAPQEDVQAHRKLVAEAAEHLLSHQIPQFVRDCVQLAVSPVDGFALTEALHARGLNIRYLGKLIDAVQSNSRLDYLTMFASHIPRIRPGG
uniref:Clu domain-containing protein n=1 Tax=Globodera pallida TaxID=36090 RepID=A0A183C8G4_GLOPA